MTHISHNFRSVRIASDSLAFVYERTFAREETVVQVSKDSIRSRIIVMTRKPPSPFTAMARLEWEGELPLPGGKMYRLKIEPPSSTAEARQDSTANRTGRPMGGLGLRYSLFRCPISAD